MDIANSAFLFAEIFFLLHGLWKLITARDSAAVSLPQSLFFTVWQIFGIAFYWHLGQRFSVAVSIALAILLAVYSATVWRFRKGVP
jgi:hypothetical protein